MLVCFSVCYFACLRFLFVIVIFDMVVSFVLDLLVAIRVCVLRFVFVCKVMSFKINETH